MKVCIHQPAYLPWLGYLARIAASDVFIYLDTVQFEKSSFTNRNRIKTANGAQWLTIPVQLKGHLESTIMNLQIDSRQDWKKKHLRSIEQNYSRAPHFRENQARLMNLYDDSPDGFADLCFKQLNFWLDELDVKTTLLRASELPVAGQKSGLVLSLCRHVGATRYLSGPLGRDYLSVDEFLKEGIAVEYQDYVHPVYRQLYGDFLPAMSVIDYWMNCADKKLFRGQS